MVKKSIRLVLVFLCILGSLLFIISFVTNIFFLGIVTLIVIAVSSSFLLVKKQQNIEEEMIGQSLLPTILNLNNLLKSLNVKGNGIYVPYKIKKPSIRVFVPYERQFTPNELPIINRFNKENILSSKGYWILPTSLSLLEFIENKFSINFFALDIGSLRKIIHRYLVKELGVLKSVSVEVMGDRVFCIFSAPLFLSYCRIIHTEIPDFCTKIGCPLSSVIACIISKITDSYVIIKKCKSDYEKLETKVIFKFM